LQKQPERRYRSALELAEDLERWGRREPVLARPRSWPVRAWRGVRRHALLSAVMILAGFVGGAGFVAYYWLDPDGTRREDQRMLANGQAVTLIGETGPPRYSRLIPFEDMIVMSSSTTRPFSFKALDRGRLELLPKVPVQSYRLSAKVRHDRVIPGANGRTPWDTGIYFAHTTSGSDSFWCELAFADLGDLGDLAHIPGDKVNTSRVGLKIGHCQHQFNPESDEYQLPAVGTPYRFPPVPNEWRTLAVEVTPVSIRVFWGEGDKSVLIREITPAELQQLAAERLVGVNNQGPKPVFNYAPQGGLGIFVTSGAAAFKQVVIEPLP
jgi:serine/threonine-protein kinase